MGSGGGVEAPADGATTAEAAAAVVVTASARASSSAHRVAKCSHALRYDKDSREFGTMWTYSDTSNDAASCTHHYSIQRQLAVDVNSTLTALEPDKMGECYNTTGYLGEVVVLDASREHPQCITASHSCRRNKGLHGWQVPGLGVGLWRAGPSINPHVEIGVFQVQWWVWVERASE